MSDFLLAHAGLAEAGLFAAVLAVLWVMELRVSAVRAGAKLRHTLVNAVFMSAALPVQAVMTMACLAAAGFVTARHVGLLYLLPGADSAWVRIGLMFVVLDLLDYVYHAIMHNVPFLWRFHLVHHTDQTVDVSTTFREHPGETAIRNGFALLWIVLCGAPLEVVILRQAVAAAANIASHTSMRLPPGPARVLGWLFVTPNLHHAHHHFQLPATNCNYGDVFSVWDRLFGTYVEMPAAEVVFGLDTHMDAASVARAERLLI
ncbi:MAG: sterol desaturase family protein [Alphaproteobacteria bacterium]|nr:sterol desaturase family protein [Alphaproteobacteria bacterium]MBL6937884.1 sterol desaturase family protein [Alphaproteobacteria bacterium]MBL7099291.1 sterol desaturase family protein [Alphaproteobacteria bacterium]